MPTMTRDSTILVVDDEPSMTWALCFSLEADGYRAVSAADGLEALDRIDELHPRAVLLDIMMPHLDGWAVLERLRELPPQDRPRVIVVSALGGIGDRLKAAQLGADAYVAKPFEVDEVLDLLHAMDRAAATVDPPAAGA
jgi:DNA-binding response OmpR family regulator